MHKVGSRIAVTLTLVAVTWTASSQLVNRCDWERPTSDSACSASRCNHPCDATAFLRDVCPGRLPGRTGQLLIVPREGDFITRADVAYMHGSPWTYYVAIPLMFAGPAVRAGTYSTRAVQQDVAPTLAAALATRMPTPRRRAVCITGFTHEFFSTTSSHAAAFSMACAGITSIATPRPCQRSLPCASVVPGSIRRRSIFSRPIQPSGTPRSRPGAILACTEYGVNVYERTQRQRHDFFAGGRPQDLMALTLADVWQMETAGRAIILAPGSIDRAATPLAGHGACQLNGAPVVLASYDQETGNWTTNPNCFRLPAYLKDRDAKHCGQRAGSGWVTKSTRPGRCDIRLCFEHSKPMRWPR